MRAKLLLIVAVLIAAASMQLHTQPNVPILEVDTLCYLGKTDPGEAKGAFFLPDGSIIVAWKDTPMIIDKDTGEITRKFESVTNKNLRIPKLSKDGRYFIASSDDGKKVWDVATGKIIKQLKLGEYCLSKDGTRMYCSVPNDTNDPGIIIEYDMNTLERIDKFCDNGFFTGGQIDISPDGQTLALVVSDQTLIEPNKKTDHVILIDLKNKSKYTPLESMVPSVSSMEFSPDGKNLMFFYNGENSNKYIYLYNFETKEKKTITQQSLELLFGYPSLLSGHPTFIDEKNISFIFSKYTLIWNIEEDRLKKIIRFLPLSIVSKNDTLLFCNQRAVIGYLNKTVVPVKDNPIQNESYIKYTNNQLEYYSDMSFIAKPAIYDTTGKLLFDLVEQSIMMGKNIIRVNQNLPVGVYLLTIKNGSEQLSYKFIVE